MMISRRPFTPEPKDGPPDWPALFAAAPPERLHRFGGMLARVTHAIETGELAGPGAAWVYGWSCLRLHELGEELAAREGGRR